MLEIIWLIIFYVLAAGFAFMAYYEASDFFLKGMYYSLSANIVLFGFNLVDKTVLDRIYAFFDTWVSSPGTNIHDMAAHILTLLVFACLVAPAITAGIAAAKLLEHFSEKNCEN